MLTQREKAFPWNKVFIIFDQKDFKVEIKDVKAWKGQCFQVDKSITVNR